MSGLVYFSSVSENTRRFVDKLDLEARRIPVRSIDEELHVDDPFVLVTPTYGGGDGRGAVPKQVIRFLNHTGNRALVRGVIAAGNTNFGSTYCLAGRVVAHKCQVPHLYNFELMGTQDDVLRVREGLEQLW
ncbi:class Ib ribonucleoside-diphosphate reductase assembly flavoprotein NrdI [Nakamurella sp. A5-74]|uniref:Protein NrdI n=1 Tax=Nakamurella sp. A5-74 TaxID=3158264 RepID=A0AAU8DPY0_9ACTN